MEPTIYAIVEWTDENVCSVINLKTDIRPVVQPRIPLSTYEEGNHIQAAYGPKRKVYSADILELSEVKAKLKKLLPTALKPSNSQVQAFDDFQPITIMDLGLKILENGTITTKKPAAETKGVDAWQEYLKSKIESKKVLLPLQTKFYQSAASYFDSQTELAKLRIKLAKDRFEMK